MNTSYKCPNLGNCSKADAGELVQIPMGAPVRCAECGANMMAVGGKAPGAAGGQNGLLLKIGAALVVLLLAVGLGWFFLGGSGKGSSVDTTTASAPSPATGVVPSAPVTALPPPVTAAAPAVAGTTLLRVHGSNTIGGKLLPALATAYLQQQGYSNVRQVAGAKPEESAINGDKGGKSVQIQIHAYGSSTAFADLKAGTADIGMSSRKIRPDEQQQLLSTLGDLSSNAGEHVLALDGVALIVNSANTVKTLSLAQAAEILSGKVTDWAQVGGQAGPITIYARDNQSGTYEFLNDAVLKKSGKTLASSAKRFEDSQQLSSAVASDPAAIGFIGLNYVGSNKVLALSDKDVPARKPTVLTVKTEDYLLARRLYLYTAVQPANPEVRKFVEFALGTAAQPVITTAGLVNMDITPKAAASSEGCSAGAGVADPRCQSADWRNLTAGAVEIETRFRFRTGSSELDTRASRDVGRIVGVLSQPQYQAKQLLVIGFADASGAKALNCKLSQERADILRRELEPEGLKFSRVVGLCSEAPVASNDALEGREKNRRVEVWVK